MTTSATPHRLPTTRRPPQAVAQTTTQLMPTTTRTTKRRGPHHQAGVALASSRRMIKLFDVNEVRRCEPFFDGDDNLDLQALASDGVILFVVINTPLGSADLLLSHELSIQGSALGSGGQVAAFSGTGNSTQAGPWMDDDGGPLSGPPFTINGDRISGSMIVADARGGSETLDVTFDVPIPSEILEC